MPPYDRRARQRGFNTRIPIYTLSGGVGRQAPSKRLPSEAQVVDNATPSLEKSIEKRSGSTQILTSDDLGEPHPYGSLNLGDGDGAGANMAMSTIVDTSATYSFTFSGAGTEHGTLNLVSSDATDVTYTMTSVGNSGFLTESATGFTFNEAAVVDSTLTLIAEDTTSNTFVAKEDGTVTDGHLSVSPAGIAYNAGSGATPLERGASAALHLRNAIYSANSFNNNASITFTFSTPAVVDETITMTSADNTTLTYIAKTNSTVTDGSVDGSGNVQFNAGATATEAGDNLESAINSTNGHNAVNANGSATWTFNTGTPTASLSSIILPILTNIGTTVSKTYVCKATGSNGDIDSGSIVFLQGNSQNEVADNFRQAFLNKNGHGNYVTTDRIVVNNGADKAVGTFTFSTFPADGETIQLISAQGTTVTYKAKDDCSACPQIDGGFTEFDNGDNSNIVDKKLAYGDRVNAAKNLAEAINGTKGHNGEILAHWSYDGRVALTQTVTGTVGNTTVTSSAGFDTACSVNPPATFTGGAGGGDVTITQPYGGTAGNTTITASIQFDAACSVNPPATFTGGTSSGIDETQFTVTSSSGVMTIANVTESKYSTSRVNLSSGFGGSLSVLPSARFGKMFYDVVGATGQVKLEQTVGGDDGNTTITTAGDFTNSTSTNPSNFTRNSLTYVNKGSSATVVGKELKTAIESSNGHNGKITVAESSGVMTLTQATAGPDGNTLVIPSNYFQSSVTGTMGTSFTGGDDVQTLLNNEYLELENIKGTIEKFYFTTSLDGSDSTETRIGIKDATAISDVVTSTISSINLNDRIRMTASPVEGSTTSFHLQTNDFGGAGLLAGSSKPTLIPNVTFTLGSTTPSDYFYYWFSVSDTLRYLLVINYGVGVEQSKKLFYIFKIDTEAGTAQDQTPDVNPDESVYRYITYKHETKTAKEALEAITIGTNIYILNKFVKAGFSSSDNGVKFGLDGVETADIDYAGREVTYYTSSLVDPEGIAFLYIPNKAYSAGSEVYNAYGVWKALVDIRAESSSTFAHDDADETVIPADPGPPEYATSSDGAEAPVLDHNIWYPYTATAVEQNPATLVLDGVNRIQLDETRTSWGTTGTDGADQVAEVEFASGMTPSVKVEVDPACETDSCERKWKETTKDSSGIITDEGDIVYDRNHSRKVADQGSGDSGSEAQDDEYISLWQYVRAVDQIPVQDNRYVSRTQQFLGQAFTDFSYVKLPPHPTDPTDIIDHTTEICDYDAGNLIGNAAQAIGILYEGKTHDDYGSNFPDDCTDVSSHAEHEFGLGKIFYVENSYAGADPGYYRINSDTEKPYIAKVRTPFKHSMFDNNRMPHRMSFTIPTEVDAKAGWNLAPEEWILRTTGDEETNPGPKMFEDGKQVEIKAMGFFRNRLWLAGEDKVFSSKLNEINNFWIDDPISLTDEDPIDITCSYNKYTEVTSLTPFESYLFVNTGSDVQFTLQGSDNQITPFTAEISPTSFYSTAPLVNPVLLGSQIYFFDRKRLYIYFNEKTVSINSAIEVSYHCPDYLPSNYGDTTVVAPYDTLLFTNGDNTKDIYCYTNRYSGEQVIQNSFFRYSYGNENEAINCWDNDIYFVIKSETAVGNPIRHLAKQLFKENDLSIPLVDNKKIITVDTINTFYDAANDTTTFTFASYFNANPNVLVVVDTGTYEKRGEEIEIQSTTLTEQSTQIVVNGRYDNQGIQICVGTKFTTTVELSPIFYRDENNNVADGILSLRTMHLRHHNTGNYRVEVTRQGRKITPIIFTSKSVGLRTDELPLERYVVDGETVSKILGFGDEVKIELISDYTTPMNITNIELKGRFNATYSSWVR